MGPDRNTWFADQQIINKFVLIPAAGCPVFVKY
jgi:hypothetical protein